MTKRTWTTQTRFKVGDKVFEVHDILGEPNTGLVVIVESSHILKPSFTLPIEVVDIIDKYHRAYEPKHSCHDCPIGGRTTPDGYVCQNAQVCDRECEEFVEAMRNDTAVPYEGVGDGSS